MDDDDPQCVVSTLLAVGYAWCGAWEPHTLRDRLFAGVVYGRNTADLEEVSLTVDGSAAPSPGVAFLGNPVETVAFHNWHRRGDGGGPSYLRMRRVWAARVRPGDAPVWLLHTRHTAAAVHDLLRLSDVPAPRGPRVRIAWSARPHVTGPVRLSRRSVTQAQRRLPGSPGDDGWCVVLDSTPLVLPTAHQWIGFHPAGWDNRVLTRASAPAATPAQAQPPVPLRSASSSWWTARNELRQTVAAVLMQRPCVPGTRPDDLATFDETEIFPLVVLEHAMETDAIQRFVDRLPTADRAFVRLRVSPPPLATAAAPRAPAVDAAAAAEAEETIVCPRAMLIHRAAYDVHTRRPPAIRGWTALDELLLPYGAPIPSGPGRLQLPPVCGPLLRCARFLREASESGVVVGSVVLRPSDRAIGEGFRDSRFVARCLAPGGFLGSDSGCEEDEDLVVDLVVSGMCEPPEAHALVYAALVVFNPLPAPEEVVCLALAITMHFFNDNRTMDAGRFAACLTWHAECFARVAANAGCGGGSNPLPLALPVPLAKGPHHRARVCAPVPRPLRQGKRAPRRASLAVVRPAHHRHRHRTWSLKQDAMDAIRREVAVMLADEELNPASPPSGGSTHPARRIG